MGLNGNRHQAYLIAKIIPHGSNKPNYRCIGAIHHQWCNASRPLEAALRFMNLIKQTENAEIIKEEIKALNGKYGSHSRKRPLIPSVPCPYTSFLMTSAWAVDFMPTQSGCMYLSNALDEGAFMQISEGDNDDGITVIDISDPCSPSYCFVVNEGDMDRPATAEEYIRHYYPAGSSDEHEEGAVASTVPGFVGIPVIPLQYLAEAWPTDFTAKTKDRSSWRSVFSITPKEVPPLADLMLGPALEQSLRSNNEEELLRLLLPHKIDQIVAILRAQNPMPDGGVFLLSHILKDTKDQKIVDLSGLYLSGQQVLSLIPVDANVEVINLSHNQTVGVDAIEQLLDRHRSLRRLVLLYTRISDDDILDLLKNKPRLFYNIEGFIHPVFLKPLASTTVTPSAYTHISFTSPFITPGPSAVALPFFNPAQIMRALFHYTGMIGGEDGHSIINVMTLRRTFWSVALAAYPSGSLREGQTWGERSISYIPSLVKPSEAMKSTEGWKLIWANANMSSIHYAFVKTNAEAMSQYSTANTGQVSDSIKDRLFQVYDVRGFFKELELEGRPAPPQDELEELFSRFATLETRNNPLAPSDF
ncbi:hypothetical protein BDN72DRAFT_762823 [Pluteus cervinus]|uniref:Uncharacterized protein n=1 Tax=Pluteus cervinus TaxID=181527 RepID=A0ACD3B446_9AGAR|nr:hypothetical protein BDN72DRAFT_762823 [Pluteus cervinus]